MRWKVAVLSFMFLFLLVGDVAGQSRGRESVDIFLDDEQLDVEADIPSVELVLTFRGLQYESIELRRSFLPELFKSVDESPF